MSMSPVPPSPGGHLFAPVFGDVAASAPPPRRRRFTGLLFTALGVVIIGVVCAGVQWGANVGYDDALDSFEETVGDAMRSQDALDDTLTELASTSDAAAVIRDADTGNLMEPALQESFSAALSEAEDAEAQSAALLDEPLPTVDEKPTWAWELFDETAQLNADRDAAARSLDDFTAADAELRAATDAVHETGAAAVQSAADAAEAFEAAHVSARNLDILSLRNAAEWLSGASMLDATTADAYADLESAAVAMLVSEQAEIAEKQGPLYDARIQIEAFARDLAPGVLLDFDWSTYVNGYGDGDSMGGLATWWYGDPGYATIELSNSVAAYWPGERSRAIVAHEVGHAISVRCRDMYDDSTQESIEAWATAWAISMGFTDDANGTSAYGAPPQSLIDTAAGCR